MLHYTGGLNDRLKFVEKHINAFRQELGETHVKYQKLIDSKPDTSE